MWCDSIRAYVINWDLKQYGPNRHILSDAICYDQIARLDTIKYVSMTHI